MWAAVRKKASVYGRWEAAGGVEARRANVSSEKGMTASGEASRRATSSARAWERAGGAGERVGGWKSERGEGLGRG